MAGIFRISCVLLWELVSVTSDCWLTLYQCTYQQGGLLIAAAVHVCTWLCQYYQSGVFIKKNVFLQKQMSLFTCTMCLAMSNITLSYSSPFYSFSTSRVINFKSSKITSFNAFIFPLNEEIWSNLGENSQK